MNFLKDNFERLKNEGLKETFEVLESAFKMFGIDYYLIGARARDLWTDHIDLREKRTTEDVDFSIYINERDQYKNLVAHLITQHGFSRDEKEPYRLYYKGTIDLIPFGGIENDGEVFLDEPPTELSVYGTKEAVAYSEVVEGQFKVVTLPSLCVLKLVAFNEKPDHRIKDVEDFYFLLENYGEIAGEQLFETAEYDDLVEDDFELPIASAKMLGRQIKEVVKENEELLEKVKGILLSRLEDFSSEEVDEMYKVRDNNDQKITRLKLISELIKELN